MPLRMLATLVLAAIVSTPALSADDDDAKKRKGKQTRGRQNAASQLLKQLEPVELTDDQVAKMKTLGAKAAAEIKSIHEAAGITPELQKKRVQVSRAMKDSDKKGKERIAAINKEAGFTAAHAEAIKKANTARMKFRKAALALLSDDQKAKLPAALKADRRGARAKAAAKKGDAKKRRAKKAQDDA